MITTVKSAGTQTDDRWNLCTCALCRLFLYVFRLFKNILFCYNNRDNINLLFQHGFFLPMLSPRLCSRTLIQVLLMWENLGRLKRREMFDWLRRKKFSIYMHKEMHCLYSRLNGDIKQFLRCCTSAKGGVVILINNNLNLTWTNIHGSQRQIYSVCDITTDKKCVTKGPL